LGLLKAGHGQRRIGWVNTIQMAMYVALGFLVAALLVVFITPYYPAPGGTAGS
jgi:hypothetical protein